ncbi:hypothetical protein P8C59_006178 [Phyllachora maydis]|uniref:DNA-directed RNA polymerase III subunit RPC9 n=1 Tax=Phyllachora maydis TaxID=1825666 RepID=A0AAD9I7L6_9PEZI|nr:hypothetical protein P8C59_006178 [Phyllachora maydis]
MKVLEAKNADLSNFEVQQHLAEMHARSKSGPKKRGMLGNLATVVKEVLEYLHTSPNPLADQEKNQHYGPETVRLLLEKLRDANLSNDLTKGEILSIVNIRPFNDVLLDTVIEDMK